MTQDQFDKISQYFHANDHSSISLNASRKLIDRLTVEKANTSDNLANYLDLTFIIESNNRLYTKLYDKHDDFDFHIVNFLFL